MTLRIFKQTVLPVSGQTAVEIDDFAKHHQEAILNLAHLERLKVKDIYLPWAEVVFVREDQTLEDIVPTIFGSGHTRLPIIAHENEMRGIINTKECLALRETGQKKLDWTHLPCDAGRSRESNFTNFKTDAKKQELYGDCMRSPFAAYRLGYILGCLRAGLGRSL